MIVLAAIGIRIHAQQAVPGATPVQQVQPFTVCNQQQTATAAGNAAATVTLTPPAGQYVYICSVYIAETANAAVSAAAGPVTFTTTNLQNNLVWWGDDSALTTGQLVKVADEVFPLFLKTSAAGTAFTLTNGSSGQSTQNHRINVTAFFAP